MKKVFSKVKRKKVGEIDRKRGNSCSRLKIGTAGAIYPPPSAVVKLVQFLKNSQDYLDIDKFAGNLKGTNDLSLAKIVEKLTKPYEGSGLKQARAIFAWIANRISFDVEGYMDNATKSETDLAENVLAARKGMSEGYANLFVAMCKACTPEIEAQRVFGIAKGGNHGTTVTGEVQHNWNLFRVDGEWHAVDCCWAAGQIEYDVDNGYIFVFNYDPWYFVPEPNEFILTHNPKNVACQLLENTVAKSDWKKYPVVADNKFFSCKFELLSHPHKTVKYIIPKSKHTPNMEKASGATLSDPDDDLMISIRVCEGVSLLAELVDDDGNHQKQSVLVQKSPKEGCYEVGVRIRKAGEFVLEIWAQGPKTTSENEKKTESAKVPDKAAPAAKDAPRSTNVKELTSKFLKKAEADSNSAKFEDEEDDDLPEYQMIFEYEVIVTGKDAATDVAEENSDSSDEGRERKVRIVEVDEDGRVIEEDTDETKRVLDPTLYYAYPKIFSDFALHYHYLYTPRVNYLEESSDVYFKLYAGDALEMGIKQRGRRYPLEHHGSCFEGEVTVREGVLMVYARYKDIGNTTILRFNKMKRKNKSLHL